MATANDLLGSAAVSTLFQYWACQGTAACAALALALTLFIPLHSLPCNTLQAWYLPSTLRPERAWLYELYALLYGVPLFMKGFEIEKYTIIMLILGQIHIQVGGHWECWQMYGLCYQCGAAYQTQPSMYFQ